MINDTYFGKIWLKKVQVLFSPKICPKVGMHKSHLGTNYVNKCGSCKSCSWLYLSFG